ncbi:MAG: site-specific integrase, partial [Longicatena sp.]
MLDSKESLLRYKEHMFAVQGKEKNTVNSYLSDVRKYLHWLQLQEVSIENARQEYILNYFHMLNTEIKASSLNRNIASIRSYYLFLNETYQLPYQFPDISNKKKGQTLPDFISQQNARKILEPQSSSDEEIMVLSMLEILYGCG